MLQTLLTNLNYLATHIPWDTLVQGIAASGILSGVLTVPYRFIKKWFTHHHQVMIVVVGLAGLLTSFVGYLLKTPTTDPSIVALQGMAIAFGTQPIYLIVIKPLFAWIGRKISAEVAKAAQFNAEVKSAAEPLPPEN